VAKPKEIQNVFLETLKEIIENVNGEKAVRQIDVVIAMLDKIKLNTEIASQITSFCEELVKTKKTEKKGYRIMTLIMR